MKIFLGVILLIVIMWMCDNFASRLYCIIQRKKYTQYVSGETNPVIYTDEQVRSYKFPKKQIKWVFHLYKGWIRYRLYRLGKIPCHAYRKFILRHVFLMKIAKTAVLYGNFEIRSPWKIEIGEGSVIGDECKLDGRNGLVIGKNVNFSTGVWIWTEQHDLNDPFFMSNSKGGSVIIDDRTWVSCRTVILPNVHIGKGSVIAAGAVVTKDCSKYGIYGGIPAKRIGERSQDLKYKFYGVHEAFL